MNITFSRKTIITAILLVSFGVIGRMLTEDMPNIETVTVATVLAAALLGGPWGAIVGLVTVAASDIIIGNTNILLYTWSGWVIVGAVALIVRYRGQHLPKALLQLTGAGLLGNVAFFVWTNFGVWHIGELYPHTFTGLVDCYIAAIPFFRTQLLSTLIFVPTISTIALALWNRSAVLAPQASTAAYAGKR
ncbi:MAG: hypothetical protein KIH62_001640 [Candidatus Kerfeldbacteria bacterium]|nr:hypothetical protein [Candidatus Kerfeldbacteria bacterium]